MESVHYLIILVLIGGISVPAWALLSLVRFMREKRQLPLVDSSTNAVLLADVAVLIAAYNEAPVIEETIRRLTALIPKEQVYVISDASSDKTGQLAKRLGVHVLMLRKNRGKTGALVAGIKRFRLIHTCKVILLLDADTRLDKDYFPSGLPLFNQPDVVAVAGSARTLDDTATKTVIGRYLLAYRQRVYVILQFLVKYGQATPGFNAIAIVPGFASMYRTAAVKKIKIDAPGFVIEDFNVTFELHAKSLGAIAFDPSRAIAYTQDPDTAGDYFRQTYRWTLGFWQAVARHRFNVSLLYI